MICDLCGNVTENKRAIGMYMRAARITHINCPGCGCALSIKEFRAAVGKYNQQFEETRYNHNHDSKGRFCSGSGAGESTENGVDKGRKSGIINYAKGDIFDYPDDVSIYSVTPQMIIDELNKSEVGRETLEYLKQKNIRPQLIYTPQNHTNRGKQQGDVIKIYMANIGNRPLVVAQTVAHEVCHHKYGIGQSQWAETVCMAKEKMLKENRTRLTIAEKRKLIQLAKDNYPEFQWRKGGYVNGKQKR